MDRSLMPQSLKLSVLVGLIAINSTVLYAEKSHLNDAPKLGLGVGDFDSFGVTPVPFIGLSSSFLPGPLDAKRASSLTVSHAVRDRSGTLSLDLFTTFFSVTWVGVDSRSNDGTTLYGAPQEQIAVSRDLESTLLRESDGTDRIHFETPSLAPMAFVRFCMRYSSDCTVQEGHKADSKAPPWESQWHELQKINSNVNQAIKPQANHAGVMAERWLLSPPNGDCNDYAVTKRHTLLRRGWSSYSLLLAEVAMTSGAHHLVLVVRTHKGDFVLDNLTSDVVTVSRTGYRWLRAQSVNNPKYWFNVSTVATIVRATSVRH